MNTQKKNEIREIQEQQVQQIEAKLRFIAQNVEEMITQVRIKQGEELSKYATSKDEYSLWRGDSIDQYVFSNLLNNSYSDIRKDMDARLNPQVEETEVFDFEETSEDLDNEFIEELDQEAEEIEEPFKELYNEFIEKCSQEAEEIEEVPSFKHEGTIHADQLTTDMITLVDLTDMEEQVMSKLVDQGMWYNWGSEPTFSDVSPEELMDATGIEGRRLRGVLSSLTKKNMLYVEDMSDLCRKNFKIVYPTYFTYKAYEADNEFIKEYFGVEDQ